MDPLARRDYVTTIDNPNTRIDYVVSLSGVMTDLCRVEVRYIPDASILTPDALATYLHTLANLTWTHLEEIAASIVSDLNNELVPRWVQITVAGTNDAFTHRVTLEDRQPRWDNPVLLSRIGSI
jgi:NADPH-dependent 7-cyano-7-deazaguanine reductase QueF